MMPTPTKAWITIWALLLAVTVTALADVYRWHDELGRVYYADRPAPGAERLAEIPTGPIYSQVRNVHDGDTITLTDGSKVRLLGINTPEIDSATSNAESGGETARRWLKSRIEGEKVRLEADVEAKDHYGRTLAHLFADNGEHLNLTLVRLGLAVVSIFPPNLKYADQLIAAQQQAYQEKQGVWGNPAYAVSPITSLTQQPARGWHRWNGKPIALDYSKNFAKLIFSDQVAVNIPKENLNLFPPLKSLVGVNLEVRGWASRHNNRYSILIRHPGALLVEK